MSNVLPTPPEELDEILKPGAPMPVGWIGVDLDGTLAYYDRWRGIQHIGLPIVDMERRVKRWLAEGREVRIFTARCQTPEAIPYIERWLYNHGFPPLAITNVKDYYMDELWDDRAVNVEPNTGRNTCPSPRGLA